MRRPKHPLLETREERINRGERELMSEKVAPGDLPDAPAEVVEIFHGAELTSKNDYNVARMAATHVVNLFQVRLFDWFEENWCKGCPHRNDGE